MIIMVMVTNEQDDSRKQRRNSIGDKSLLQMTTTESMSRRGVERQNRVDDGDDIGNNTVEEQSTM